MYNKTIRQSDKEIIYKGDKLYLDTEYGLMLRKIVWIGANFVEWRYGYCSLDELKINDNKKSKVKYIVKNY
jgi:hypothetical protein